MKYRQIAKKLIILGCQELPRRGGGSHRKWLNPVTKKVTVIPNWSGRDLKIGTVKAIIRQLGIEWDDFENSPFLSLSEY